MISKRVLVVINVSLTILALLLILNLAGIKLPSLGQAFVSLDKTPPLCVVQWQNEFTSWDNYDRCCFEARRQLECVRELRQLEFGEVQWHCKTGTGNIPTIWFNSKAYAYCQQQPIW